MELKRRQKEIYFYKSKENYEIDFVVHENPVQLIQVCYSMLDKQTEDREKRALLKAMHELNIHRSTIITYNEESTIIENGNEIKIIPIWKFLIL